MQYNRLYIARNYEANDEESNSLWQIVWPDAYAFDISKDFRNFTVVSCHV